MTKEFLQKLLKRLGVTAQIEALQAATAVGAITKAQLSTSLQTDVVLPERAHAAQTTAATLATSVFAGLIIVPYVATILSAKFIAKSAAASGESMVITVAKNGVTIGTFTYDSTKAAATLHPITLTDTALVAGDTLNVARTYTAGGTPTPMGTNAVELLWIKT